MKRLLKRIDINTPDSDPRRYTALAWAAICGSEETFLYLLDTPVEDLETSRVSALRELRISVLTSSQDAESNTITMLLADTKPPIAASPYELRSDSVDLGAALRMARAYTERNPDVVDWQNNAGKTALHIAAMRGNELFVRVGRKPISISCHFLTSILRCYANSMRIAIWRTTKEIRRSISA